MSGEAKFFTRIDQNMGLLGVKKSAMALNQNFLFSWKNQKSLVVIVLTAKITEKCTISNFSFDMLEAVQAIL